ncbi:MAG: VCBS repeat-containing protein [Planctomycetota bacterium]|nr:VCBS repeat-containing protein [Planctomycetota bacterium]
MSDYFYQLLRWGLAAVIIPIAALAIRPHLPALGTAPQIEINRDGVEFLQSRRSFEATTLAMPREFVPRFTNVTIVDFDVDGRNDILACDARSNSVILYLQTASGEWTSRVLGNDLVAPAHASVVDLDRDGDLDVVVAVLGNISPDDGVIGRVVLLENNGDNIEFTKRILLDDVQRVADVQPGDFDGDGDWDLAVAVFGYARGSILWLENLGDGYFRDHELLSAPGAIHLPVADFDGDGDLDIATVFSQEEEEVWGFENLGNGRFRSRRLFFTVNFDIGSAGLVKSDLDGDGDVDLILPVGDDLEDQFATPQPYHGCLWLENKGNWTFETHRIAQFGGTYAADAADLDGDGDIDVVLVSMLNAQTYPQGASLIWLENDGHQSFRAWRIAIEPTQLVTVACGDVDGDRAADIVTGRLNVMHPRVSSGGIDVWLNRGESL